MRCNDSFKKTVETLDEPLQEILCSLRNSLHVAGSKLSKNDEPQRNNPADHHGIGNRKAEEVADLDSHLRQAVLLLRNHRTKVLVFGIALAGHTAGRGR